MLVVLFHFSKWCALDSSIVKNGYLMVELFFVLSGFVMFNAYARRISTIGDLIRFQFLRLGRLYPVHLLFLTLFLLIEVAKFAFAGKLQGGMRSAAFGENDLGALVQQLFLVQGIGPTGKAYTFNVAAWSISVEFYIYLMFGAVILLFRRWRLPMFGLLALAAFGLLMASHAGGFGNLLRGVAGFFTGCLMAYGASRMKPVWPAGVSSLMLLLLVAFLAWKPDVHTDLVVFPLAAALILTVVMSPHGWLSRLLSLRGLTWLGLVSYSVYMSHGVVLWVVSVFYKRVLHRPEVQMSDGSWVTRLPAAETAAALFSSVALTLIVSWLTYRFVEKPCRDKTRALVERRLQGAAAVVGGDSRACVPRTCGSSGSWKSLKKRRRTSPRMRCKVRLDRCATRGFRAVGNVRGARRQPKRLPRWTES